MKKMNFWNDKNINRAIKLLNGDTPKQVSIYEGVSSSRISGVALSICRTARRRIGISRGYNSMREALEDKEVLIKFLENHLTNEHET